MTRDVVLALDAGTGSGRALAVDRAGATLASAHRPWSAASPPELAPLGREYDAGALLDAITDAAREVVREVGAARVAAITVTGQRIGCAFEDAAGTTVYAGPNGDVRAMLGADLSGLEPEALYRSTGRFPPWIFAPARLRWMEASGVEVARVHALPGWIAARLGAEHVTSPCLAADLMMLDVATRARAPLGEDALWPAVAEPGTPIGALHAAGAAALGLPDGLPIVLAPADTPAALAGEGLFEPADCVVAGSSAPLLRVLEAPVADPAGRLWCDPHAVAGRWLLEANLGEMGTSLAWTAELLLGSRDFAALDRIAATAELGCAGASAHLGPRAMDLRALNTGRPAALLLPFGQTTGRPPPGRPQVLRAALESCAFAIRAGSAWLDAASPALAGAFTVLGGLARSSFFCALLADVLGRVVVGSRPEASARGAAMCAAVGLGWSTDLRAAARAMRPPEGRELLPTQFLPDEDRADDYDDAFEVWEEREAALERF